MMPGAPPPPGPASPEAGVRWVVGQNAARLPESVVAAHRWSGAAHQAHMPWPGTGDVEEKQAPVRTPTATVYHRCFDYITPTIMYPKHFL